MSLLSSVRSEPATSEETLLLEDLISPVEPARFFDEHWEKMPEQAPHIDRKPSEYFHSNCFISCDPDEPMIPEVVKLCGDDRIVYASDYYHWDCAFPDTVKLIAERGDLSDGTKRKILGDNAKKLFRL